MKMVIRKGVFETNSSSTHAIAISKQSDAHFVKEGFIKVSTDDFGWEEECYSDIQTKLSYLLTGIMEKLEWDTQELGLKERNRKSKIEKFVKEDYYFKKFDSYLHMMYDEVVYEGFSICSRKDFYDYSKDEFEKFSKEKQDKIKEESQGFYLCCHCNVDHGVNFQALDAVLDSFESFLQFVVDPNSVLLTCGDGGSFEDIEKYKKDDSKIFIISNN